jgi:hypothetical protein
MAGFIRGLALIGVMAVYSPVHHGMEQPNWTESAAGLAGAALFGSSARAQDSRAQDSSAPKEGPVESLAGQALTDLARELGPDMARRLAELDPDARRILIDMTLAAAAKANAPAGTPAGEARPRR